MKVWIPSIGVADRGSIWSLQKLVDGFEFVCFIFHRRLAFVQWIRFFNIFIQLHTGMHSIVVLVILTLI